MLYHLLFPLHEVFSPLNVFRYITFRSAVAGVTAILLSFLVGPAMIRWLRNRQYGQQVRDDGPQTHLAKQGTPTMGGLLIITAIVVPTLLWSDLSNGYVWVAIVATLGFGLIGLWDDALKLRRRNSKGLSARGKLLAQIALGAAIGTTLWWSGFPTVLTVPFYKAGGPELGWLFVPFTVLVLVGAANAVNLTDGLDGLAIGLTGIVIGTFALLAYAAGNVVIARYLGTPAVAGAGELSVFALSGVGAALGFLWFNSHPAEVFMGDVGSMGLGGAIGTLAVITKQELLLVLAGGIFVAEAASVILQVGSYRYRGGKRIFRMAPLHHHFELGGWHESKVVIRFWILGILLALSTLATLKLR
jgi:phospho-N-acetylmuramoyl-pentapeptide-transferase